MMVRVAVQEDMFLIAIVTAESCDQFYEGCTQYYKDILGRSHSLILRPGIFLTVGNKYMTSKSYGTISLNSQYNFFSSWKLETWNSFCITADTEAGMYRTLINGKEVLLLSDYEGTHQERKGNIFLLNASYKETVNGFPLEVGPWVRY